MHGVDRAECQKLSLMEFMTGLICKPFTSDMSNNPVLASVGCSKDFKKEEVALLRVSRDHLNLKCNAIKCKKVNVETLLCEYTLLYYKRLFYRTR